MLAIVMLADLAIYRGVGEVYAGWAAVFGATPFLLYLGALRERFRPGVLLLGATILVLAARIVWCGSPVKKGVGLALLPCFAVALAGYRYAERPRHPAVQAQR